MKKINFFVVFLLLSIIILLTIMNLTGVVDIETKIERKKFGFNIPDVEKFYEKVNSWEDPKNIEYPPVPGFSIPGSSIPTVYTYERANPVKGITPNIERLINDIRLKSCHPTLTKNCIDEDQIYANYQSRKCKESSIDSNIPCYNLDGEEVAPGSSVQFMGTQYLPPCQKNLGSLVFNYKLLSNGKISPRSRALSIEKIKVTENFYKKNKRLLEFYEKAGIIDASTRVDDKDNIFYPTFNNKEINTYDVRQKLNFVRFYYDTDAGSWVKDNNGIFVAIIFRGLNAYLTIEHGEEGKYAFIFKKLGDNEDESKGINWIYSPPLDLSQNIIPGDQICSLFQNKDGSIQGAENTVPPFLGRTFSQSVGIVNNDDLELPCKRIGLDNKIKKYPNFLLTNVEPNLGNNWENFQYEPNNVKFIDYEWDNGDYKKKTDSSNEEEYQYGDVKKIGGFNCLLKDPFSSIAGFAGEYFSNSFKGVSTFSLDSNTVGSGKPSKENIIDEIDITDTERIDAGRSTGNYFDIKDPNPPSDDPASFNIIVVPAVLSDTGEEVGYINSITLNNGGSGYTTDNVIKLLGTNIGGGEDIEIKVSSVISKQRFRFVAIPNNNSKNLSFIGTVNSEGKIEDLNYEGNPSNRVYIPEFSGSGYDKNDIVKFSQQTLNGRTVKEEINDTATVQSIIDINLFVSPLSNTDDDDFNNEIINNSKKYNFLATSGQQYESSPAQLIWGKTYDQNGEINLIETLSKSVLSNKVDKNQIESIFFNSKIPGTFITDINNLLSIQYEKLKYTMENEYEGNIIEENTNLVLGKFIPYSKMKPMYDSGNSDEEDIVWNKFGNEYYNHNNFNFIEFGNVVNGLQISKCQ